MATKPRATRLRAVKGDEAPRRRPRTRRLSVQTAAASGNQRDLLVAMRERISRAVDDPDCSPRDLAALTRRLADIAKEVDSMDRRAQEEAAEDADSGADQAWDTEVI